MPTHQLDRELFRFLDDAQMKRLKALMGRRKSKPIWRMGELCNALKVEPSVATLVMATLDASKLGSQFLLIYHNYCEDAPIKARLVSKGMPPLPFECEECQGEITEYSELRFDFELRLNSNSRIA